MLCGTRARNLTYDKRVCIDRPGTLVPMKVQLTLCIHITLGSKGLNRLPWEQGVKLVALGSKGWLPWEARG